MKVTVSKNKVVHDCTSEEQLARFLKAGWKKVSKKPDNGDPDAAVITDNKDNE